MNPADVLELIKSAELEAAQLIRHAGGIIAETKTDARNVVTEYDRAVQKMLVNKLSEAVPGAHFFCEETDRPDSLDAEHVFIIDPIDGTMNFVKGFNHSCIAIAYSNNGKICAAAVYDPFADEMFTGCAGDTARLNGKPIHVTGERLSESVVCVGTSPYDTSKTDRTFEILRKLFDNSLDIRRRGSAELDACTVAAGRAGLYFELQVSLWDYAAGTFIATQAGAVCMTAEGESLPYDATKPTIVVGTPEAAEDYLKIILGKTDGETEK